MGNITRKLVTLTLVFFIFTRFIFAEDSLSKARKLFLKGEYEKAILISEQIKTSEAKVFQSRVISIYTHFYKNSEQAKKSYLNSYKVSKEAISLDKNNAEAYVEAAHSLGRYGQEIGIMAAITKGIADRVKKYLDTALLINNENIIANLSKGIWHAEIVNQAGKTIAKAVYGASANKARSHFKKVVKLNSKEIGILYEISYGYYLLGTPQDIKLSLSYLTQILNINDTSHLDSLYREKAITLRNKVL